MSDTTPFTSSIAVTPDGVPPPATQSRVGGGSGAFAALYALTIFLSAFLLFQVQPLIGKYILPWFGGTPGVWTTCMLFFQLLLFGGYLYAHLTSSRLTPRMQAIVHACILLAACALLPIVPNSTWKPHGDEDPVLWIVLVLGATVGLPFFALSATGPLLQSWFSRTHVGRSPYRLYALSNIGSLLALISYPAVFDWTFATTALARLWSWCFVLFVLLCATCAAGVATLSSGTAIPVRSLEGEDSDPPPSLGARILWFLLAMVPSVLLLATTNQVCLDVASVPFLWVLPLTLYLLSFILCFDGERWYSRRILMPATIVAIACLYPVLRTGATVSFAMQILAHFTAFFLCAMVCHGELVRRKPHVRHLTSFYLLISAGGAAGGLFVAVLAPLLFKNYYELHIGLFACVALMFVVLCTDRLSPFYGARPRVVWLLLMAALGVFAAALLDEAGQRRRTVVAVTRNFYGVLRVTRDDEAEYGDDKQTILRLMNGRIVHGFEYQAPELQTIPTSYYAPESAIGLVLNEKPQKPRRVGLVGLGIGTLAAYARPGDHYRFYEINRADEEMARRYFHYLELCRGDAQIIHGDARLTLDREKEPQNFDVLVLDAFSGDAIPVHLLTTEAFAIYLRHLAPDGIIAVHISNRHFSLRPVVDALADKYKLATATIDSPETNRGAENSLWVLVSRDPRRLAVDSIRKEALEPESARVLWTDDHAPLSEVLWKRTFKSLWSNIRGTVSEFAGRLTGHPKKDVADDEAPDNESSDGETPEKPKP